jgi:glycolate oxidase iron-sulfur subunit
MGPVDTGACVHCGLCLPSCPTYLVTGDESESPRGRVVLLNQLWGAIAEGRPRDGAAARAVDSCLDCRACEEVCPAHVPVGHAVEAFRSREVAMGLRPRPLATRQATRYFGTAGGLRRFQRWVRWTNLPVGRAAIRLTGRIGGTAGAAARLANGVRKPPGAALGRARVRMGGVGPRVALLYGCVMDAVYAETAEHAADLLRLAGYQVVDAPGQVCCGALHTHAGDPDQARAWARQNLRAFAAADADRVAVTAAGCGAAMKEYGQLWGAEAPTLCADAENFAAKVADVAELINPERLPALPARSEAVAIHDACHLAHAQGIRQELRAVLLRAGYRIVEMSEADVCCGSAGLYNLTHPDMAAALQRRKVANVPPTADVVATSNPGCLLQIQAGLVHAGRSTPAVHWVDLVWQAASEAGVLE